MSTFINKKKNFRISLDVLSYEWMFLLLYTIQCVSEFLAPLQ